MAGRSSCLALCGKAQGQCEQQWLLSLAHAHWCLLQTRMLWLQWLHGGLAMHTSSNDLKCLVQQAGSDEVALFQDQNLYLGVCKAYHK